MIPAAAVELQGMPLPARVFHGVCGTATPHGADALRILVPRGRDHAVLPQHAADRSLGDDLPEKLPVPEAWPDFAQKALGFFYELFRSLVNQLPLDAHAKDMAQGIVQAEDIAYYFLFTAFFLFLTFRAFETRKWRA